MIEAEGTCMISASTSTTSCHLRTISEGTWAERGVIDVVAEELIDVIGSCSCDNCSRSCVLCRIFGALSIHCGPDYAVPGGPAALLRRMSARSTHSSNCGSSNGLLKKQIAPAFMARSRMRSCGKAVMKMIGMP
jgi:hypothetical protein